MGQNPYEAPPASLVYSPKRALNRADLREIAVLHRRLLFWLQMELGLLCVPMALGALVVANLGDPFDAGTPLSSRIRLLVAIVLQVPHISCLVGIAVAWVMGFLTSCRLCRRICWTPVGWLLAVLSALPIYGIPV
jgi:hypothetical protein